VLITEKKKHFEQTYPGVYSVQKTSTKAKSFKLVVGIILIIVIGFIILTRNVYIVEANYRLQALEKKLDFIKKENEKLKVKLAELKSYDRIEYIAKTKLHMIEPSEEQVVIINPEYAMKDCQNKNNTQISTNADKRDNNNTRNILSVVLKNIFKD